MYGNNYGYNPYLNNNRFQPQPIGEQPIQSIPTQAYIPPVQPLSKPVGLLGKSVDSIDVVKAQEIPLDGSTSYFPLADGSAIVTKQLRADGTSKTTIYKPVEEEKSEETPKYVTIEELKESIKNIDLSEIDDLWDELKNIKEQIKNLKENKKK